MPFPRSWLEICGGFEGRVTEISVIGQLVWVVMDTPGFSCDEQGLKELIAVGYSDQIETAEQDAAWESSVRDPVPVSVPG